MNETPASPPPEPPAPAPTPGPPVRSRRWFDILAVVVLAGFAVFVAAVTILSIMLPSFRGR